MNRTLTATLAASLFALGASSAFAGGEVEQTQVPASSASRIIARADLSQARAVDTSAVSPTVAQSVDRDVQSARSRADVKAEAVYAARHPKLDRNYVGG